MTISIAIVGRPNVGKSSLFNRLCRKKMALVDDMPGVTRDWRTSEADIQGHNVCLIDTAGLEDEIDDSIRGRMRKQTEQAIEQADVVLFMIDGREGVTPLDSHFAQWLRRQSVPTYLLANKCEGHAGQAGIYEAYGLGLGDPLPISSAHGDGIYELFDLLMPHIEDDAEEFAIEEENKARRETFDLDSIEGQEDFDFSEFEEEDEEEEKSLKMAIVGRPNVGKSTLMNALLKEHRVMTGPEPGVTRDAIAVDWEWEGQKFRLVDTAGMRKRSKVQDKIEKMSVEDSLRAIRLAQVVVLVLDGELLFDRQDLTIARHVIDEGRALVIAVNKWDIVKDKEETLLDLKYQLEDGLPQVRDVPAVTISALNGRRLDHMMKAVMDVYQLWNFRIGTGPLNRWLKRVTEAQPAPMVAGRSNKMRYITQVKSRPPTFAIWVSRPKELPDSYRRYLINGIRRTFDLPAVPIRLMLRKTKNPFAGKG